MLMRVQCADSTLLCPRQVPGKSQQECFDRIQCDHITAAQSQPRSRAKTKLCHDSCINSHYLQVNCSNHLIRRLEVKIFSNRRTTLPKSLLRRCYRGILELMKTVKGTYFVFLNPTLIFLLMLST